MSWTDAEADLARAWRAEETPVTYAEIARRLGGGRSGEAVRQKLISDRIAAARGGRRGRMDWREGCVGGARLGDRVFQRLLMAGGGHSRFSEIARNSGTTAAYWALVKPLLGPDGLPRPCAAAGCRCVASEGARACGRFCGRAMEDQPLEGKETADA
jgi:hypothetical protein